MKGDILALTVLRKRLGLTQAELAEMARVSQPEISLFETGEAPLSGARLRRVFVALATHTKSDRLPDSLTQDDLGKHWDEVLLQLSQTSRDPD